jgi:hypothetical protein
MDELKCLELYFSKVAEYDNLLMQNTIIKTKLQSMELVASNIDVCWNLVQDIL